ncbi:MAG: hypothetical protein RMZ41_003285 [Nostoc sp. DedVER02]|uniref:hypothetical protein n=1 Tax=unclassified Nostoc TaxID=2593658 RepID=UPI002AD4838F|nr:MULTISPECIES: hypothetical protein [unclassified Nostoc]MDZ7986820.1 hypothetical protein [Nostoc sp. DedVER02]MDZ8115722.1 hypothetical protein [Nostoc sp. DedVER01b]
MTALTDALETAIAARQTLIDAQEAFDAATVALNNANIDSENARAAAFVFFPPELLSYPYTDSNGVQWAISKDNNPTITLRPLNNELPIPD